VDEALFELLAGCEASPPLQSLATHTGALAFTGTFAATDGLPSAELTWTVPAESVVVWSPEPFVLVPAALALESPLDCTALPPFVSEATVTGASALTGAFTETAGSAEALLTWALPTEESTL